MISGVKPQLPVIAIEKYFQQSLYYQNQKKNLPKPK